MVLPRDFFQGEGAGGGGDGGVEGGAGARATHRPGCVLLQKYGGGGMTKMFMNSYWKSYCKII